MINLHNTGKPLAMSLLLALLAWQQTVHAGTEDKIPNYLVYSESFASSGQPDADDIAWLAGQGYERIIYLALTTNGTALAGEDKLVIDQGVQYVHIPVDFMKPTVRDFNLFAAVMNHQPDRKTLVHCQINMRASTFSFLYRVIHQQVPIGVAKQDLDAIWVPDPIWYRFIVDTLAAHGESPACDTCDWGERDFDTTS